MHAPAYGDLKVPPKLSSPLGYGSGMLISVASSTQGSDMAYIISGQV